jgi:hypothetical protein
VCVLIFDLGHSGKLFEVDAAHFTAMVRAFCRESFTVAESFLDRFLIDDIVRYMDSYAIYEMLFCVCSEKHRTNPEEITRRLKKICSLMHQCSLPLTVAQENMLKNYNLFDDTIISIVTIANK